MSQVSESFPFFFCFDFVLCFVLCFAFTAFTALYEIDVRDWSLRSLGSDLFMRSE